MTTNQNTRFWTPENSKFYKEFRYIHLDQSSHEIRLLKINANGIAKHSLISNVSLEYAPRYTALSYCAGDPNKTRTIEVDGQSFAAFKTLNEAIDNAVRFWADRFPGNILYLWADQICINQSDNSERTHQVNLMRDIYSRAENVLIWLPTTMPSGSKLRIRYSGKGVQHDGWRFLVQRFATADSVEIEVEIEHDTLEQRYYDHLNRSNKVFLNRKQRDSLKA